MRVFIVDHIGIHSGMHYYLQPFKKVLKKSGTDEVTILSNYSDEEGTDAYLRNQYKGKLIAKICSLCYNYLKLRKFIYSQGKNSLFIILSYGSPIDYIFVRCVSHAPYSMVDIHEAVAQNLDSNRLMVSLFRKIYSKRVNNVIYHSQRTREFLDASHFNGIGLYVPHFRYEFSKECDISALGDDLKSAIKPECINYLFFGNLNYNKGVDIFISAVNSLPSESRKGLNFIIAGKNFDNSCHSVKPEDKETLHLIVRHISDHEMIYLFSSVQYIAMPYRKTSQSGIVEMALYFKRPIIVSDLPYFRTLIEKYPSFGILSEPKADIFAKSLIEASARHGSFFSNDDLKQYNHHDETEIFRKEFNVFINNLKNND